MASTSAETAVRTYLAALRDPSSMRDETRLKTLKSELERSGDELERLRLRQQIFDLESPTVHQFESAFVTHAKAWADEHGVTAKAFEAEGVPVAILRKAGLAGSRAARARKPGTRRRVTVDEVRAAIPRGAFTIKGLQEISGASPAVVRKVVADEVAAGTVKEQGPDPDHRGPGRSPTLYKKGK